MRTFTVLNRTLCLAVASLCTTQLLAQTVPPQLPPSLDPGAIQSQSMERQKQLQDEEALQRARRAQASPLNPGSAAPAEPVAAPSQLRVLIQQIVFSPSVVFSADELRAFSADYAGHELGFADMQALVAGVNAAYRQRGLVAAQALLPAQDVASGVLQIRLVEGRIGQYTVQGNASTLSDYVLLRMHVRPGDLVDVGMLEQDLIWFNRSNDIQLGADLRAGQAPATSDVSLQVQEPAPQQVALSADNAGGYSTGEVRYGISYTHRSLLGYRDAFTVSATNSAGDQGRSASYAIPVNTWGGRVTLAYNDDRTRVLYGTFGSLHIAGSAESWSLSMRQPLRVRAQSILNANLSFVDRTSHTFIEPMELNHVTTNDYAIGLDGNQSDAQGTWSGSFSFTSGSANTTADPHYQFTHANLQRDQIVTDSSFLRLALTTQDTSDHSLPSGSQFFIGGAGTVRGYANGNYSGLSGYVLNLEYHQDVALNPATLPVPVQLSSFVFFDQGHTSPYGPGLSPIDLQSVGVGLDYKVGKSATGRLTFGQQLLTQASEFYNYRVDANLQWLF
jgi:hemolysin activation/secretion protein